MNIETRFIANEFDDENKMFIHASGFFTMDDVVKMRNFFTEEINRKQKEVADMLDKINNGNTSPEIN
jgi:hypothetical protein